MIWEGFLVGKFHEKVANTPIPTLKGKFTDEGGSFSQIIIGTTSKGIFP